MRTSENSDHRARTRAVILVSVRNIMIGHALPSVARVYDSGIPRAFGRGRNPSKRISSGARELTRSRTAASWRVRAGTGGAPDDFRMLPIARIIRYDYRGGTYRRKKNQKNTSNLNEKNNANRFTRMCTSHNNNNNNNNERACSVEACRPEYACTRCVPPCAYVSYTIIISSKRV